MKISRKLSVFGLSVATTAMLLSSCTTVQNTNSTTKGAVIGTVAGGAVGALIGGKAGNTAIGAIAGAVVGGAAGTLIGRKMDKQAKEIENAVAGAEVIQTDEGIIVKFDQGILFDFNKSDLKSAAKVNIEKLVETLNKEPDTEILVLGHTDNIGTLDVNQRVSEARAKAVRDFAVSKGLGAGRVKVEGKNYSEPIAANDSEENRAKNRRVEVVIVASKKMQDEAKKQVGQ